MLSPWAGNVISPGDVTTYATLCALATLERGEVKRRVVEGDGLPGEGEGMKEIVDAWMGSRFKSVLELLEKFSVRDFSSACSRTMMFYLFPRPATCSILCSRHTFLRSRQASARGLLSSTSNPSLPSAWNV